MSIDLQIAGLLTEYQHAPFAWGRFDCCQFVRAALRVTTGQDIEILPYRTERGAARALAALGGYDGAMEAYAAHLLPSPLLAQRGDVVLVRAYGLFDGALALCTGQAAHAAGSAGLTPVSQSNWLRAWRVQCLK